LPIETVHYLEGEAERHFLVPNDLVGIMGNAPFLAGWLVLDFLRERASLWVPPPSRADAAV